MSSTATRKANLQIEFDANASPTFWGGSEIIERGEPFFDLVSRKGSTATFENSENCDGLEEVLGVILLINNETFMVHYLKVTDLRSFSALSSILESRRRGFQASQTP